MKADQNLAADIEKALAKHTAAGGTVEAAIATLRAFLDSLTPVVKATQARPVPVASHARSKPTPAPASPVRLARKATVTRQGRSQTIFDTFKLADGTPIGGVYHHELPAIARRSTVDAAVCWAVYNHAAPPTNQPAKVRDLVSETFLEQAIKEAKGNDDVAA